MERWTDDKRGREKKRVSKGENDEEEYGKKGYNKRKRKKKGRRKQK